MCVTGNDRGEPRSSNTVKSGAPQKALPIEIPAMSLDELNRLTGNFGQKALIGEGSYGRVFYAKLSNGKNAAIKKLDTGTSQEPDSDFSAQVRFCAIVISTFMLHILLKILYQSCAVINSVKT